MHIITVLKVLRKHNNSEQAADELGINRNTITKLLKSKLGMNIVQVRNFTDEEFQNLIDSIENEEAWIVFSLSEVLNSKLVGKANRSMIKKVINSFGGK